MPERRPEPDDIDVAILRALRGPRILAIQSTREGAVVTLAISRRNAQDLIALQYPEEPKFMGQPDPLGGPGPGSDEECPF